MSGGAVSGGSSKSNQFGAESYVEWQFPGGLIDVDQEYSELGSSHDTKLSFAQRLQVNGANIDLSSSDSDCDMCYRGTVAADSKQNMGCTSEILPKSGVQRSSQRATCGESDAAFAKRLQQLADAETEAYHADLAFARQLQLAEQNIAERRQQVTAPTNPTPSALRPNPLASAPVCADFAPDLVERIKPVIHVCGTLREPLVHVKNVDGCQGRLIANCAMNELLRLGMVVPTPRRGKRSGIVVEWHKKKRSKTPWRTGLRIFGDLAEQVLKHLRHDPHVLQQTPALQEPHRGWNDTELLVTTPGCSLGRHHDAQPPGSLLLIFCAGLSCLSQAWPEGVFKERILESGDCMILDGRLTAHAVPCLLEGTSPLQSAWLNQRRLAVLIRQCARQGEERATRRKK